VPEATVRREFEITRAVHASGAPCPAAFEMFKLGDRHGIVFERVHGHSLVSKVERKPWTLFAAARQLAELQAQVHACPLPSSLPSQRDQLERWVDNAVDFSPAQKEAARRNLAQLPPGDCLCHGDFHPANLLLAERGPVIIDWSRATRGHALADVARTSVLFEQADLPKETSLRIRLLMKLARRLLHASYLKRYLELRPGTLEEIEKWRVPQRMVWSAWRAEKEAAMIESSKHQPPSSTETANPKSEDRNDE
jgi:aminoglycoside phosphotransferase (APT) family kinase protein